MGNDVCGKSAPQDDLNSKLPDLKLERSQYKLILVFEHYWQRRFWKSILSDFDSHKVWKAQNKKSKRYFAIKQMSKAK
jgi:hypothetical protein